MELRRYWVLAGIVSVAVGVAAGELFAALLSPAASPVSAVGQRVIDGMPGPLKEWAISTFGTADKTVFLVSMIIVMAACAGGIGLLERLRRGLGMGGIALFGMLGVLAIATGHSVSGLAFIAPVLAAVVAGGILRWAIGKFLLTASAESPATPGDGGASPQTWTATRRGFLQAMSVGSAVAVVAGGLAFTFRNTAVVVAGLRDKIVLPKPAVVLPPVPAAATFPLPALTPWLTPNDDFYRIDTAFVVPEVNSDSWQLSVTGMVERPLSLNYAELLAKPLVEKYVTIGCVSNQVGGNLVGNALWLGWPVSELLAEAGVLSGADMVLSRSTDGFTAGTPLQAMTDARDALLAVGMNGAPLPLEHGFPVRLIVPGLYGYVSATKWLAELKLTTFAADQGYWIPRGWSERGPIKTASRLDVPKQGGKVQASSFTAAGLAWAPERGISAVQVQIDGGPWQAATLAESLNADTWVQWKAELSTRAGQHTLQVRALDGSGVVQTSDVAPPAPDGATGYDGVKFTAI